MPLPPRQTLSLPTEDGLARPPASAGSPPPPAFATLLCHAPFPRPQLVRAHETQTRLLSAKTQTS